RIARALAGNTMGFETGFSAAQNALRLAETVVGYPVFRRALRINEYQGIEYFHQEAFDALRWLFVATVALRSQRAGRRKVTSREARIISRAFAVADQLRKAERSSGFETAKLLAFLRKKD
ncbi:MAG: hypothetical protein ACYDH3_10400, partial [Candidatus Aminicenantales bacterium]